MGEDDAPEDATALYDATVAALVPEHPHHATSQVVPPEEVALEDLPQRLHGDVLRGATHSVRAVVEERVERSPGLS